MCNFSFYFAYVIFCHAIFNGIECYHGFPFLFLDLKSSLENFSQLLASRGNDWGCTFVDRRKRAKDHIRVSGVRRTQKTSDHHGRNLGKPFLWVNRIGHLDQNVCPVFVLIAQSLFFSISCGYMPGSPWLAENIFIKQEFHGISNGHVRWLNG